jgi:enoyl-CoA hydratase
MSFTEIAYETRGPVTIIRFNRPEVRNCIGPTTRRELIDAWTRFRDDSEAKVAIITGTGDKAFCAGGDLKAGDDLIPLTPAEIAAHHRSRQSAQGRELPVG